jgi:diguanylate cyclase (GGDEF)-like protein
MKEYSFFDSAYLEEQYQAIKGKLEQKMSLTDEEMQALLFCNGLLEQAAIQDPVTGTLNIRGFRPKLEDAVVGAGKKQTACDLLLLIDLDNFKRYNDTYGHLEGNKLLKRTAQYIANSSRPGDQLARIGGDEFSALKYRIPHGLFQITGLLDRIVLGYRAIDETNTVSLSVGAVIIEPGVSSDNLLHRADDALYDAKNSKDCARLWQPQIDYVTVRSEVVVKQKR